MMVGFEFPPEVSISNGETLQFTWRMTINAGGFPVDAELLTYRIIVDLVREAAEVAHLEQEIEEL